MEYYNEQEIHYSSNNLTELILPDDINALINCFQNKLAELIIPETLINLEYICCNKNNIIENYNKKLIIYVNYNKS